ncbi:MAG: hypothetical protein ABR579_01035 [Actinomycetota bacterium]
MRTELAILRALGGLLATALITASCSSGGGPASHGSNDTLSSSPSSTAQAEVKVTHTKLPPIQSLTKAHAIPIKATQDVDWALVAYGKAWIKGVGKGIGIFDAKTGRPLGSVRVAQGPCAAMDAAYGSIWTATCDTQGVARINGRTGRMTGFTKTAVSDGESTIGAGEGGVWIATSGKDCTSCVIARIDPKTMKVVDRFPVPVATAVRVGLGGVWVTDSDDSTVLRLDPSTGDVVATIPVGREPRFFDVGSGGVWVMDQLDGSLCQIDPSDNAVVGCPVIDRGGVEGGDLVVGNGYVWFRGSDELVAQIDPKTGKVLRRIGAPQGSGSVGAGSGQLWITAHDVSKIYRIPVH